MNRNARETYLENEVLTATPQRLRKMLIDGAIRQLVRGREAWRRGDAQEADLATSRTQDILTELLSGVKPEDDVARKISALYVFLIQRLLQARQSQSPDLLDEILGVMEVERETWRQVCERYPDRPVKSDESREILASEAGRILGSRTSSSSRPIAPGVPLPLNSGSFTIDA